MVVPMGIVKLEMKKMLETQKTRGFLGGYKGIQPFRVFIPFSPWLLSESQPLMFDSTSR